MSAPTAAKTMCAARKFPPQRVRSAAKVSVPGKATAKKSKKKPAVFCRRELREKDASAAHTPHNAPIAKNAARANACDSAKFI